MIPTLTPPTPSAPPSPDGTIQAATHVDGEQLVRHLAIERIQRRQ